ncbi:conjugative transposon protein TraN [Flavobacterium agrisoli]|uniref:Conjugative transposon protein TraN n=1 Tax=Flavobacterium agrisoli TaxID=2793066 RepID=A0A934PK52_9FLAO|nr:conjugative transposon protein TraN [Flavobacterium agrisoli]MBK0368225.1 conjugative transposon protein TraN [Flavobacterium agrisoli]
MKKFNYVVLLLLSLSWISIHAQFNAEETDFYENQYKNLRIGFSKTTSIVFPYAIKSVDIGSAEILVQKAKALENILLVKALKEHFYQTNLTTVTADGRLYIFVLNYDELRPDLHVKADNAVAINKEILFTTTNENEKKIEQMATLALSKKSKVGGIKRSKYQIGLQINGIFIDGDVMYFRVVFENNSSISYEIDQLRFFIRDQKKSKRTASQEIEILPLYTSAKSTVLPENSAVVKVFALEKFTIPEKKYLTLEMIEKKGGRHVELNLNNNRLSQILPIGDQL